MLSSEENVSRSDGENATKNTLNPVRVVSTRHFLSRPYSILFPFNPHWSVFFILSLLLSFLLSLTFSVISSLFCIYFIKSLYLFYFSWFCVDHCYCSLVLCAEKGLFIICLNTIYDGNVCDRYMNVLQPTFFVEFMIWEIRPIIIAPYSLNMNPVM